MNNIDLTVVATAKEQNTWLLNWTDYETKLVDLTAIYYSYKNVSRKKIFLMVLKLDLQPTIRNHDEELSAGTANWKHSRKKSERILWTSVKGPFLN